MSQGKETVPYSKTKTRAGYSTVSAIDPADGKQWDLLISHAKMDWEGSLGMGRAKQLAYTVPYALLNPKAIFRGVREKNGEEGTDDWLCYCALPPVAYNFRTGEECVAWLNEVFNVYVTHERIVYSWFWNRCDEKCDHKPFDHETRFFEQLL